MDKKNKTIIQQVPYVDIYDGPDLQFNMTMSILFYVVQRISLFFALYVNTLVHRMAQREKMVLSWEFKVDSICNIFSSFYYVIYMAIAKFSYPMSESFGQWSCKASDVIMSFDLFRTLTITFTIGVYRYIFIVHGDWINIGESRKKVVRRAIFVIRLFFLVLFTSKFVIFNRNNPFIELWNHWCDEGVLYTLPNSSNETTFMVSTEKHFYSETPDRKAMVTLFGLIKNGGLSTCLKIFCVLVDLLIFLCVLNVTEGVLHYKIGKFLKM